MNKLLLILLLPSMVWANYNWKNKKVDSDELQKEFIAAGCSVDNIDTSGDDGTIFGSDCAAAAAVLAAHDPMKRENKKAAMKARAKILYAKSKARLLTDDDEQQEFMEIMYYLRTGEE